jgi:hypothetical protein
MISLSILVTVLAIGWSIKKVCTMAMASLRKAGDIKPLESAPAPASR